MAIALDFFVVTLIIEWIFDTFRSSLGTWPPSTLIVHSSWLTGILARQRLARNPSR